MVRRSSFRYCFWYAVMNFRLKVFRTNVCLIIAKYNLKIVHYLDVTLNLSYGSYKPFHKRNSEINYIHRELNHSPSIRKQLPLSVESRLCNLWSDENVFIQSAFVYQEPLKCARYNCCEVEKQTDRNTIYFNKFSEKMYFMWCI